MIYIIVCCNNKQHKMSLSVLFLTYIAVLCLVGPPLALLSAPDSPAFNYLVTHNDLSNVHLAYAWTVYAVTILGGLYLAFVPKRLDGYETRRVAGQKTGVYFIYWIASISTLFALGIALSIQSNFSHPLSSLFALSQQAISEQRALGTRTLSLGVYGVGLNVFGAASLVLAFAFLERWWVSLITICACVWFATFHLAKAPIVYLLLEVLIISMLIRPQSISRPLSVALISSFLLGVFIMLTTKISELSVIFEALALRLFLGEFADLPTYFQVFADEKVSAIALLPPYIQSLTGMQTDSVAQIVSLKNLPDDPAAISGAANTFFVGEAFAAWGLWGAILSPFLVFAILYMVITVFTRLPKTFFNVFIFGYLLFKILVGTFTGISVYLFSSIHIVFIAFVLLLFVQILSKRVVRAY